MHKRRQAAAAISHWSGAGVHITTGLVVDSTQLDITVEHEITGSSCQRCHVGQGATAAGPW